MDEEDAGGRRLKPSLALVASADRRLQSAVTGALRALGIASLVAANGHQAMVQSEHGPTLLVLDMDLPGMISAETLAVALRTSMGRSVPTLALASGLNATARARRIGADETRTVPCSPAALRATIRSMWTKLPLPS